MRPVLKKLGKLTLQLLSVFLIIVACGKDDGPEVSDPAPKTDPEKPIGVAQDPTAEESQEVDPNLVTQSLILDNATIIEGELPGSGTSKSMLVDLKIDNDTIFWTPGVTQRIKFKKPVGTETQSALLFVTGSNSYINADFRHDEASEEISILHFAFDPTSWQLPVTFPLKIIALDAGGNPLDEFERPVVIEKPFEEGGLAGKSNDDDDYVWEVREAQNWYWKYTVDIPNDINLAQCVPNKTPGTTEGCCNSLGESDPGINCPFPLVLDYENIVTTSLMKIVLYADGTVFGREDSVYENLDVWNSDFCFNIAAYSETGGQGLTGELPLELYGTHTIDDIFMKIENVTLNETKIGAGSYAEYVLLSEHFMMGLSVGSPDSPLPDGLGSTYKFYQKAYTIFSASDPIDDNLHDQPWFD